MRIAEHMLDARFAHHRFADVIGELNTSVVLPG